MVKGKLIFALFLLSPLWAQLVEIEAQNFLADEKKGLGILSGNVIIKREKDILKAEQIDIFMDKNRKPLRYEAKKNPNFDIVLKGKNYTGSGETFIYDVKSERYIIEGDVQIFEENTNKKLFGDKIIIDRKNGTYAVESKNKKPVRFVFEMDEK